MKCRGSHGAARGGSLGAPAPPEGATRDRRATAEEMKAGALSIPPDGTGLPPGQGRARQGEPIFAARCTSCHGAKGEGATNDRLVGGLGTFTSNQPVKTVGSYWQFATTLFDYTRRAVPYGAPLSLTADETYAVTAYMLSLNGIVSDNDVMNA